MEEPFDQKMLHFAVALSDAYKEDDEKEGLALAPLEMKKDELTEDFTAMIICTMDAVQKSYRR